MRHIASIAVRQLGRAFAWLGCPIGRALLGKFPTLSGKLIRPVCLISRSLSRF